MSFSQVKRAFKSPGLHLPKALFHLAKLKIIKDLWTFHAHEPSSW